jgi:hypothetical protein
MDYYTSSKDTLGTIFNASTLYEDGRRTDERTAGQSINCHNTT